MKILKGVNLTFPCYCSVAFSAFFLLSSAWFFLCYIENILFSRPALNYLKSVLHGCEFTFDPYFVCCIEFFNVSFIEKSVLPASPAVEMILYRMYQADGGSF